MASGRLCGGFCIEKLEHSFDGQAVITGGCGPNVIDGIMAEPLGYVTADEAYGRDPALRERLRELGIGYVLAVARNHYTQVTTTVRERVDVTESWLSALAWQRRNCGPGSKGQRFYEWAWVEILDDGPGLHSLLIHRNSDGDLTFCRCWSPQPVPLATLVRVAGTRWTVEETFQIAKGPGRPRPVPNAAAGPRGRPRSALRRRT